MTETTTKILDIIDIVFIPVALSVIAGLFFNIFYFLVVYPIGLGMALTLMATGRVGRRGR